MIDRQIDTPSWLIWSSRFVGFCWSWDWSLVPQRDFRACSWRYVAKKAFCFVWNVSVCLFHPTADGVCFRLDWAVRTSARDLLKTMKAPSGRRLALSVKLLPSWSEAVPLCKSCSEPSSALDHKEQWWITVNVNTQSQSSRWNHLNPNQRASEVCFPKWHQDTSVWGLGVPSIIVRNCLYSYRSYSIAMKWMYNIVQPQILAWKNTMGTAVPSRLQFLMLRRESGVIQLVAKEEVEVGEWWPEKSDPGSGFVQIWFNDMMVLSSI